MCAIALKNIEIMKREGIIEHVRATAGRRSAPSSRRCSTSRSSATCAAPASSTRIELVKDKRDEGDVRRRRVRVAAARLPLAGPVRGRADLPAGRSRRPGRPDLAAARRGRGGDGRDRRDPRRRCSARRRSACPRPRDARPRRGSLRSATGRREGTVNPMATPALDPGCLPADTDEGGDDVTETESVATQARRTVPSSSRRM